MSRPSPVRHLIFLVLERFVRILLIPRLRARALRLFGARIGSNVRVSECRLINLANGFRNLTIENDVFVGPDCLIDLEGPVHFGRGATLSPRVMILSHSDPGSHHRAPLTAPFPPQSRGVTVGPDSWIGAGAILLDGVTVGEQVVVAAGAVVTGDLAASGVYAGIPAVRKKDL